MTGPMNPRRFQTRLALILLLAVSPVLAAAATPPVGVPIPGTAAAVLVDDVPAAPATATTRAEAIAARLSAEIEAQQIVGISIAIVEGDRITHAEHRGWEDREREIPTSAATMYRWASISKPLTAIAAMQLVEAGKLDLDCDVRTLVPEFPENGHIITPRQLLCHQGGIVHYVNGPVVRTPRPELDGRYVDVIDALDLFKESPLVGEPGAAYSYSTHGYILLGAVVQRAGGEPFAEQVRGRIAAVLGMETLRPDYQWEEIPHRTVGYRRRGERIVRSTNTDVSWKLAGGGYISTAEDLARLAIGVMNDRLVSAATREQMFARQSTAAGERTSYGLGFQIGRLDDRRLISHGGSQEKTRTLLLMLPDEKVAVAIMCNTEGTNLQELGRDLLRVVVGEGSDAVTSDGVTK